MKSLLAGVTLVLLSTSGHAQITVPCWYVPNGTNVTMQCSNGYWHTITAEGMVYTGNGTVDPSAAARGSSIIINPATGGPFVGAGPTVEAPDQVLPMLAPHQSQLYGYPIPD